MAINLLDITANNNDLTNVNATEVTASLPFAQSTIAVDFEADDSAYLSAGDSVSLSITGDLTLEGWFKFESLPGSNVEYALLSKMHHSTAERSYKLGIEDFGTMNLAFLYSTDGSFQAANKLVVAWTPSTATWYHVAVTFLAATAKVNFYVDGAQQGTEQTGSGTSIFNSTRRFQISGFDETSPESFFDGVVDDVRVWNDVRTEAELDDNKSIELVGDESGLVAYWPFEVDLGGATTSTSTSTTTTSTSRTTSTSTTSTSTSRTTSTSTTSTSKSTSTSTTSTSTSRTTSTSTSTTSTSSSTSTTTSTSTTSTSSSTSTTISITTSTSISTSSSTTLTLPYGFRVGDIPQSKLTSESEEMNFEIERIEQLV